MATDNFFFMSMTKKPLVEGFPFTVQNGSWIQNIRPKLFYRTNPVRSSSTPPAAAARQLRSSADRIPSFECLRCSCGTPLRKFVTFQKSDISSRCSRTLSSQVSSVFSTASAPNPSRSGTKRWKLKRRFSWRFAGAEWAHQAHHGPGHPVLRPGDRRHQRLHHLHHLPCRWTKQIFSTILNKSDLQ